MKTTVITLGGKKYTVPTNNSGELSNDEEKLKEAGIPKAGPALCKLIQDQQRIGRSCKGKLQFKDDNGRIVTIGHRDFCKDGENVVDTKNTGTKVPAGFYEAIAALSSFSKLPQDMQSFVKAQMNADKSKDELLARIAELEKQLAGKKA